MANNRITDAVSTMEKALTLIERRESLGVFDRTNDIKQRERLTESLEKLRDRQQSLLEERKQTIDKLRADLKEISDRKEDRIQALTTELREKSGGITREQHDVTLAELRQLRQDYNALRQKAMSSLNQLNSLIDSLKQREAQNG